VFASAVAATLLVAPFAPQLKRMKVLFHPPTEFDGDHVAATQFIRDHGDAADAVVTPYCLTPVTGSYWRGPMYGILNRPRRSGVGAPDELPENKTAGVRWTPIFGTDDESWQPEVVCRELFRGNHRVWFVWHEESVPSQLRSLQTILSTLGAPVCSTHFQKLHVECFAAPAGCPTDGAP
jgi:hypothetical protein